MKSTLVISGIICCVIFLAECTIVDANNKKDLDQNMLDMMMYHDNLGLYLRKSDADYSSWLLEGMDSTLQVIAKEFDEHRKLSDPFLKSYKKLLAPSINDIRSAIRQNDFPAAITSYRILTKNCNKCHLDNEIEKTVIDGTDPNIH
jgi:hypothetical protein